MNKSSCLGKRKGIHFPGSLEMDTFMISFYINNEIDSFANLIKLLHADQLLPIGLTSCQTMKLFYQKIKNLSNYKTEEMLRRYSFNSPLI